MKYLEINYFDADFGEQQKLLGSVWHLVHAIASRNEKVTYQVAFPFWKDPARADNGAILKPGTFGPIMRIFADSEALAVFETELKAHRLIQSGMVSLSEQRTVPEDAATTVSFVRSRARDRVTDGYAARDQRRSVAQAQKGKFAGHELHRSALLAAEAKAKVNFVALRSAKNGQRFSLNVERRAPEQAKAVNSYGLGGVVPQF